MQSADNLIHAIKRMETGYRDKNKEDRKLQSMFRRYNLIHWRQLDSEQVACVILKYQGCFMTWTTLVTISGV